MGSKAIYEFIRSVGLTSKFNAPDPLSEIIPRQYFASQDNKFIFLAMYIGNKELAREMVGDYMKNIDKLNKHGCLSIEYSLIEEIGGIVDKEWAHRLEELMPYECRTAEIFSIIKAPLRFHGVMGDLINVSFSTQDGYYVSFTELVTSAEVKNEDVEYLLSGKAIEELVAVENN